MFIDKVSLPRTNLLERNGRHAGPAAARCHDSGATALASTPARPRSRYAFMYVPHGADMASWTPAATGREFALSPTLKAGGLEPFRDSLVVVSNLKRAGTGGRCTPPPPRAG